MSQAASTSPARPFLQDRHVVVTGAGTGIGRAIALRLAEEGARLSLMARDVGRLEATVEAIGGGEVGAIGVDIRDRAAVDRAFAQAAEARGGMFGLVANAGIGGANEPGEGDRFDELVATNLVGTYSCARAAQRHLVEGPGARHMVLMASVLGRFGVGGYTGYCASKTGVIGLARALAMELAGDEVQVNAVCPGWVDTEMAREGIAGIAAGMGTTEEEAYRMAMSQVPLGRMSEPEDVAGLVGFLMSPGARGITGQAMDMNGGAWMG